jgi:ABC-type nitrate/sulfonate/bicarbonate transport system substrate-binding protein
MFSRFAFALVVLLFGLPLARGADLIPIKVTTPTASAVFIPLYDAQKNGDFAKVGLDVQAISTNGDGPDVDALIAGSAQFTISTPNRLFMAFERGKRLLAVASMANRMNIDCAMNKAVAERLGITPATPLDARLKLMKGLTVAGTRPGAFTYLLLQAYGKRAGLVPQKDFRLIGVGGPASMLPALENGQIAVGCTGSPFPELAVARGKGIIFADNSGGTDPDFTNFLYEMVYVLPDYAKAHPQIVRNFLKVLFASVRHFLDAKPATLLPEIRAYYPGLSDPVLLQIIAKTKESYNRSGVISAASVAKAGTFLVTSGAIKHAASFADVADNQYLPKP